MKMAPDDSECNFRYTCPECESQHWITQKQATTLGFMIVCCCDYVIHVATLHNINVTYDTVVGAEKSQAHFGDSMFTEALRVILKQGFSKEEAMQCLGMVDPSECKDATDMIRKALSEIK
jgi:hypothetical protein